MTLVSACLVGIRCRYDGQAYPIDYIIELVKKGRAIPICPEQLGGLPIPRSPCQINENAGLVFEGKMKIIDADGFDRTKNFIKGAKETLRIAKLLKINEAILKDKSPSCGHNGITSFLLKSNGIKISWLQ